MTKHTYTPKDVEKLVGITTASLREQRTRFIPYTFGKQNKDNGRWTYTSVDMVAMACIPIIEPYVRSQYEAAAAAYAIKNDISKIIGICDGEYRDFLIITERGNFVTNDRSRFNVMHGGPVLVISVPWVANHMPQKLVARLKADLVE